MLDMTKLFSMIPVWKTLSFIERYRITGMLELVCSHSAVNDMKKPKHFGWLIMRGGGGGG